MKTRLTIPRFIDLMTHGPVPHGWRYLHRIYRRRYKAGVRHLSRCRDLFPPKVQEVFSMFRVDSKDFQRRNSIRSCLLKPGECITKFLHKRKIQTMCRDIRDRFEIYGYVGRGTSAYILAAREKTNSTNQYVFKVHPTGYYKLWEGVFNAPFGYYVEVGSQKRRFLPTEAVYLQLLSQCPRFPQLDSVYMHNDMTIIVMSAEAVVKRPERGHLCTENPLDHHFPSYSGDELIDGKTPRLTEIQVCKVATHILQALMYLMDMNMSHDDLSHRNYLVDENLNTTLIDLGFMHTAPSESGWKATFWIALLATEFLISPEIAQKLQSSAATDTPTTAGVVIYVRHAHDIRTQHMWKFGALIYDLLHGYAPWELPHWDPEIGALRDFHLYEKTEKRIQYIRDRRWRMINEDLPIDDRLSQDCVDVLRAMLAKDVAKRPALRELVSFPWFQGHWADYPAETFRRPPYLPREPTQGRRRRYSEQRS